MHLSTLSWSSLYQYSEQYSFQATGCFPKKAIFITVGCYVRGMKPVAMTIIDLHEEWPSRGSNLTPPIVKFYTVPTELPSLGGGNKKMLFTSNLSFSTNGSYNVVLTLFQTTNFRLFQIESVCRQQYQI